MPKLKRPDGRVVSVSVKGVEPLLARGYEAVEPERAVYEPGTAPGRKLDFPFAAGRVAPEGEPSLSMSRQDLNAKAVAVGVEDPRKLANKQAVLDAINATLEG